MTIEVTGHGRLIAPASRTLIWREVYNNSENYNDKQLFGAGRQKQNYSLNVRAISKNLQNLFCLKLACGFAKNNNDAMIGFCKT